MLKAIIISDSHGDLKNVRKIAEKEHNIDLVIHLGDLLGQDEQLAEIFNCEIKKLRETVIIILIIRFLMWWNLVETGFL